ncbi:MAG: ATP-binding protein [Flavobacteriales bacterium]|nr:ATP-binding protein [Flavobacteriales bacterium]
MDKDHVAEIDRLVVKISAYVKDSSQKRPLVFMMSASPGSGKSHFIKCIGRRIKTDRVEAVNYNMASMMSPEDLIPALDAARNHKVEDNVPLLFLDEFDSEPGNIPMLLPLLWDGEITIGQRNLKLGKMIIVLAGSDPALPEAMKAAASMDVDSKSPLIIAQPKYTDLFLQD